MPFNPYDAQQAKQERADEQAAEDSFFAQARSAKVDFGVSDAELAEMSIEERNATLAELTEDFRRYA